MLAIINVTVAILALFLAIVVYGSVILARRGDATELVRAIADIYIHTCNATARAPLGAVLTAAAALIGGFWVVGFLLVLNIIVGLFTGVEIAKEV